MVDYIWIGFTFGIGCMLAGMVTGAVIIGIIAIADRIENKGE